MSRGDSARVVLEEEHGERYFTVAEAAEEMGITPFAIYQRKAHFRVERFGGMYFVPESVVHPPQAPIEIRGVELQEHVGRVDVTRYLCLPCRRYFRSLDVAETHGCFRTGRA